MTQTLAKKLAEHIFEGDLSAYVRKCRQEGQAWRHIARNLREVTDGVLDVTDQTLRNWFPNADEPEPAPRKKRGAA